MARIRSHLPSLWTNERFVELSFAARLLWLGLENHADDAGVFEWKPKSLRMAIYPADNVDIDALLAELIGADLVRRYEVGGKWYGAIAEFGIRQKPKKPRAIHPSTLEIRTYTSSPDLIAEPVPREGGTGTEPVPHIAPTAGENRSLMERRGEVGREDNLSPPPSPAASERAPGGGGVDWFDVLQQACRLARIPPANAANMHAVCIDWARAGLSPTADIYPAIEEHVSRTPSYRPPRSVAYFTPAAERRRDVRLAPPPAGGAAPPAPVGAAINWDAAGADAARLAGAG